MIRLIVEVPLMLIAISPAGSGKPTIVSPEVQVTGPRRQLQGMPPINWREVISHRSLPEPIQAIS